MEHPFLTFLDHTQRRSTVGRAPLDEWSALRLDLYLTTHDTHNWQTSMGSEPTISAGKRPKSYDLILAATGIGRKTCYWSAYNATLHQAVPLHDKVRVSCAKNANWIRGPVFPRTEIHTDVTLIDSTLCTRDQLIETMLVFSKTLQQFTPYSSVSCLQSVKSYRNDQQDATV